MNNAKILFVKAKSKKNPDYEYIRMEILFDNGYKMTLFPKDDDQTFIWEQLHQTQQNKK